MGVTWKSIYASGFSRIGLVCIVWMVGINETDVVDMKPAAGLLEKSCAKPI